VATNKQACAKYSVRRLAQRTLASLLFFDEVIDWASGLWERGDRPEAIVERSRG
jgi:hypothetical protein